MKYSDLVMSLLLGFLAIWFGYETIVTGDSFVAGMALIPLLGSALWAFA